MFAQGPQDGNRLRLGAGARGRGSSDAVTDTERGTKNSYFVVCFDYTYSFISTH